MSDSSDDEDLSRFRDAVDTSFLKLIDQSRSKTSIEPKEKPRSERYLDVATHYNDVKVSEELQRRIGAKVSAMIAKNTEFVDVQSNIKNKKRKIKGGVKLFKDSADYLSCDEPKNDILTEVHNKNSKKIKNCSRKRHIENEIEELSESDKINLTVVSGDFILAKEDTKFWKSKRKEKLFKYKSVGKNKSNLLIEA